MHCDDCHHEDILLTLNINITREYVQRCFSPSRCKTEDDKDQVETALKKMLTKVFEEKRADFINWDQEPLPRYYQKYIVF